MVMVVVLMVLLATLVEAYSTISPGSACRSGLEGVDCTGLHWINRIELRTAAAGVCKAPDCNKPPPPHSPLQHQLQKFCGLATVPKNLIMMMQLVSSNDTATAYIGYICSASKTTTYVIAKTTTYNQTTKRKQNAHPNHHIFNIITNYIQHHITNQQQMTCFPR